MVPEPATWPAEVGPPGRRPDHIMVPEPATWPAEVGPPTEGRTNSWRQGPPRGFGTSLDGGLRGGYLTILMIRSIPSRE